MSPSSVFVWVYLYYKKISLEVVIEKVEKAN